MSGNETENWPEINSATTQQLLTATAPTPQPGAFDPYKAMLMKKQADDGKPVDTSNVVKWPEADIKQLEDFCMKMGIVGFNCGRMSPLAALAMLKNRLGVVDHNTENTKPRYEDVMNRQKVLLKG